MTLRRTVAVACALTAGFTGVLAQPPAGTSEETVRIDAIVTDRRDRPLRDLRAADFEVVDSGEARTIDGVALHKAMPGRIVAIFLDDFHIEAGDSSRRAREALQAFITTQLHTGDRIAVMKPLDPLNNIRLSTDREAALKAVDTFEGRKGDYVPRTAFEQAFISRAPRAADASRAQVVTSALQALTTQIGEAAEGRKAVIIVSDGFSEKRGRVPFSSAARTIVYAANRFGVSLYPISPGTGDEAEVAMIRMLAEQTGGEAGINQPDLSQIMQRAVRDLDEHYVVTYRAPRAADGKFHPVSLSVKRPDSHVRARSGYWAAISPVRSPGTPTRAMFTTRPSHASPYIRPWIGTAQAPDGLTRVSVTWEAGAAPPRNQRVDSVLLKATSDDGRVVFQDRLRASQRATFDVAPGTIAVEMALEAVGGSSIDTDVRSVRVPDLRVAKPTFATAQLLRTRSARTFAAVSADPDAVPSAAREFSRTERLLLRVPVYGPGGTKPTVTAILMNRLGAPMRKLTQIESAPSANTVQFDLPLSSLAPDEYRVELVAKSGTQEAREVVLFRVVN